ncbi:lasso RiPP family leader peptide-containing protein [Streptomyces sp. NPDC058257]
MSDRATEGEQQVNEVYEPPMLTSVGEFSEDTLGFGSQYTDVLGEQGWG